MNKSLVIMNKIWQHFEEEIGILKKKLVFWRKFLEFWRKFWKFERKIGILKKIFEILKYFLEFLKKILEFLKFFLEFLKKILEFLNEILEFLNEILSWRMNKTTKVYCEKKFRFCCRRTEDDLEVNLIDFQLMTVGSPAVDLNYFFGSSTFPTQRTQLEERWLRLYHTVLIKNLAVFGYPESLYKFSQLKHDFDRARLHGFCTGLMHTFVSILTCC